MATVLRVRRKRSCDPVEALVLSCKRAKSETKGAVAAASAPPPATDEVKKVFKLVGTVDKKDQPIATKIQTAIAKPSATKQKSSKTNSTSKTVKEKSRSLHDDSVQSGRYRVISTHRGLKLQELDATSINGTVPPKPDVAVKPARPTSLITKRLSKKKKQPQPQEEVEARQLFSFFDLEHQEDGDSGKKSQKGTTKTTTKSTDPDVILCNNVQMIREKLVLDDNTIDSEYVYDLYYIDEEQVDFEMSDGATIGMHYGDGDNDLTYEFYPSDKNVVYAEEDDDSNDENNWRNDYPDEDPDKRHPDLFDELLDDYNYGANSSSDDDLDYGDDKMDYRHRAIDKLDLEYCDGVKGGSGSDLDEYGY